METRTDATDDRWWSSPSGIFGLCTLGPDFLILAVTTFFYENGRYAGSGLLLLAFAGLLVAKPKLLMDKARSRGYRGPTFFSEVVGIVLFAVGALFIGFMDLTAIRWCLSERHEYKAAFELDKIGILLTRSMDSRAFLNWAAEDAAGAGFESAAARYKKLYADAYAEHKARYGR